MPESPRWSFKPQGFTSCSGARLAPEKGPQQIAFHLDLVYGVTCLFANMGLFITGPSSF